MERTQTYVGHPSGAVKTWPNGQPVKQHSDRLTICPGEGCEGGVVTVDYCPHPLATSPAQRHEACEVCGGTGEVSPDGPQTCGVHGEARLEAWVNGGDAEIRCAGHRVCGCDPDRFGCDQLDWDEVESATCPECGETYRDADHEGED